MKSGTQPMICALALALASALVPSNADAKEKDPADAESAKSADTAKSKDAKSASGDKSSAAEEETEPGYDNSIVRGLSWDLMAGGIPESGALVEAELGFSGLPRVAYHYSLSQEMSVGGMVAFDYAYWAPAKAFAPSLLFQAPIRLSFLRSSSMSIGVRLDPGLGLFFEGPRRSQFVLGFLLNGSANIGFALQNRLIVGGGIDVPMLISIPTGGADVFLSFPVLFGPILEFHVTPPLAITFDFKVGPHVNSSGGTAFGLRMMAGLAYRL